MLTRILSSVRKSRAAVLALLATALIGGSGLSASAQAVDPIATMGTNVSTQMTTGITTTLPYVVGVFAFLMVIGIAFRMFRKYAKG